MSQKQTAEQLAQWIIDNRYLKSEMEKISDFEMYHHIKDQYQSLTAEKDKEIENYKQGILHYEINVLPEKDKEIEEWKLHAKACKEVIDERNEEIEEWKSIHHKEVERYLESRNVILEQQSQINELVEALEFVKRRIDLQKEMPECKEKLKQILNKYKGNGK